MEVNRSIKTKMFALLICMGAIPFIIVIMAGAYRAIAELEESSVKDAVLRNFIISEHVTEMFEKNFYTLHTLALNPMIVQYLESPDENHKTILQMLKDTNFIFHDMNLMALTDRNGLQLLRTDGSTLVNVSKRRHFQEAMKGNDFISDTILSMSTGKMIVVLEVPVKDEDNNPIGMLQRNFDLSALQQFVEKQDTDKIYVMIIDREGRMIASTYKPLNSPELGEENCKYLLQSMHGHSGSVRIRFNNEDAFASYSRNLLTDWMVVTVQPYHFIMDQVYVQIAKMVCLGLLMLTIVCFTAYVLSNRATKPIIDITNAADQIAQGMTPINNITVMSDDEIGQMADAFNKMRLARDTFRQDAELDQLTKLYNKKTLEHMFQVKLEKFKATGMNGMMVLFIIDLDHFKEINDTRGHQFGDRVLKEFAINLRKCFRPTDCIGRFGGDEFVVILENIPNVEVIERKAKQIQKMASELSIEDKLAGVTASIGIAIAPKHGLQYEELFRAADEALYYVKKHGRNNYRIE